MSNNEFFNTKQIPDSCADCQPTGNANAEEGNVDSNNGSHVNTQTYSMNMLLFSAKRTCTITRHFNSICCKAGFQSQLSLGPRLSGLLFEI